MKQIIALIMLISIFGGAASADAFGTFSTLVRFHSTIGELVRSPQSIDPSRLYMVEGMVTAVRIVNPDPEKYYAEIDFISAEWDDQDAIHTYRVILVFSKPDFAGLLVDKGSLDLNEGQIGPNSRGLALIQFASMVPVADNLVKDSKVPVFIAHDFRILK
jgi:hypothetical protein